MVLLQDIPKPNTAVSARPHRAIETDEVVVYCPRCKTMETLILTRDGLGRTKKFIQVDDLIFHDCGSGVPCRLFRAI